MSNDSSRTLEDMTAKLLLDKPADSVTHEVILSAVRALAPVVTATYPKVFSEEEIASVVKRLEERFDIKMSLGTLFADEYRPWLAATKGDIDWFYWNRYKRMLNENGMPPYVLQGIDHITDQILDHMENPQKTGKWSRKGMVVGHVQSGKTANYIGVVNKAADSGYRVIIVLAGTLNSLRSQTQERLDSGFLGIDTSIPQKPFIGVGEFTREKMPAYFTTSISDFRKSLANSIGVGIKGLKEPAILVIKKNPSTLANLIDWLRYHNKHNLKDHPMLLIDDEADNASINTSKAGEKVTAINGKIRELLQLFERSSYVGYTATPFANVFIDPLTDDEMIGDDLFPRDFIISLDPPSNYVGASRIFSSDADLNIVRTINDFEDYIPVKHKIGHHVSALPPSCEDAITAFVLARTIRLLRSPINSHNSMLVNISRFTKVQSQVKLLVDQYVQSMRQAIVNYSKLSEREALNSPILLHIKEIWEKEYAEVGIAWRQVQETLKDAVSPIEVVEVNSSAAAASLDFSRRNYPNGRNVIAVGGLSLSRGLTLEGLTISYFLRNSIMYDTLMQMGRWFGYRDGYADICRIYMSNETVSWYGYISDVMEELRGEFRRMKLAGLTPKDFGLAVRSHPDSLIVTARNKMRTGQLVTRQIDLAGRLVETAALHKSADLVSKNLDALAWIVGRVNGSLPEEKYASSYLWKDILYTDILDFVEQFQNHRSSLVTETGPLKHYIDWLASGGRHLWDVLLVNPKETDGSRLTKSIGGLEVRAQLRTNPTTTEDNNGVILNKRRVASRGLEKAGLSRAQTELAQARYGEQGNKGKNYPDKIYRDIRDKPLLMLHLLDIHDEQGRIFPEGVAAYGISFPGNLEVQRSEGLVQYVVNTVWWNNMYSDLVEDDDDDLGIDE